MAQIITISGMLGSGKSTVSKMLAEKLGYEYYSTGMAFRNLAEKKGITVIELNQLSFQDLSIDQEIDSSFAQLAQQNISYVIDSRLAFFFVPTSLKIKLDVDINVAGRRIFEDKCRTQEQHYQTLAEATAALAKRRALEVTRWLELYGVNIEDLKNFDLIIDSTNKTPEQICAEIIAHCNLL
ncbi:MAG: cytidylate kinase family protein [Deltaproteobacteria bacterium]|jgi:cytidylate kinase|nr:cytidylate kinase family protein [Deltaproteobacteria bacterium]